MDTLDELQRELWRVDRREARHTISLDALPPFVALADSMESPEETLMRKCAREELVRAESALSDIQRRRLLVHSVTQLKISEIARREGCSERAVKFSLAKARKRLKELLEGDSPMPESLSE